MIRVLLLAVVLALALGRGRLGALPALRRTHGQRDHRRSARGRRRSSPDPEARPTSGRLREPRRLRRAQHHDRVDAGPDAARSRRAADPAQRRERNARAHHPAAPDHRLRAATALRADTDAQQDSYAGFMATLARDLPTVDGFAVWNEPNLNTFWLYQYDAAGKDIAAPAYTSLLARTYDALKAVSPEDQGLRRQPRAARLRRRRLAPADALADAVHPRHGRARIAPAAGRSRSWTSSRSTRTRRALRSRRAAAHGHVPRVRRLRQARGAPRHSLRRHRAARLEAPDRVHGVRRPVADPAERAGRRTRTLDSPLGKDAVPEKTQARVLPRRRSSSRRASRT